MPRPVGTDPEQSGGYLPGLDGLRALAVVAVLGYHLGVPLMSGGLLGVGMFFTLSGFLITRILVSSHDRTGTFQLRRFWVHRARRLLPAVVLVLVTVLAGTALVDRAALGRRWGESWGALAYVANWHTIARGDTYFDRFAGPGPLDHLWSLSVEEQFYLVWPLLLIAMFRLRLTRAHIIATTAAAAVVSFALLSILAVPGFDHTRAYEGTDTRAGGILVGAVLALCWPQVVAAVTGSATVRNAVQAAGVLGIVVAGWLVATTDDYSLGLYDGGILALSVATAATVAAVAAPDGVLNRVLGVEPLRWIGERSYGIYLWQLPLVVAVGTTAVAGSWLVTSVVLVAATLVLAELSWRLVEDPIRRHGFAGALRQVRRVTVPPVRGTVRVLHVPVVPAGAACLVVLGVLTLAAGPLDTPGSEQSALMGSAMPPVPPDVGTVTTPAGRATAHARAGSSSRGHHPRQQHPRRQEPRRPLQTSCRAVAHIGESTSIGLVDPAYLPDPAARLPARLRAHGVREVRTDILGARSIVERWHDQPNAQEGVQALRDEGFEGCWTVAMGTNDSANQVVGGVYPYGERIDLLMEAIGPEPVLWLTVKSRLGSGPYDDENMRAFDDALLAACERYPNLRVYDWRAEVHDDWFVSDRIHFTSAGYAARATRIGNALARAFPADGAPSPDCVVGSGLG
ncbi:acyltransferase family protein [Nocardioides sp.]|uniref:acyltransferase family protein n=1 Tax=Nocardioides sp. TaxID=35761 RepID=UPI00378300EA